MFKPTKKKPSKAKEKVDFKLEFHATRVPQRGWDKLMVSLISLESNKVTAKTGKVPAKNGVCLWSEPVYESPWLFQDKVSGKDNIKAPYKLLVSMGLSRFGVLGEAPINFADYMQAAMPVSLPLQLQNCSSGSILHVKIQRLGLDIASRELEGQQEIQKDCQPAGFDVNEHCLDERSQLFVAADKDDCPSTSCLSLDSLEAPQTPEVSESRPYNRERRGREELASPCSSIGSCSGRQDLGNTLQEYGRFSEMGADNQRCIDSCMHPAGKTSTRSSPSGPSVSNGDKDGAHGPFKLPNILSWTNKEGKELEVAESTIKGLKLQSALWEQRFKQMEEQMELLQKQHLQERTRNEELQTSMTSLKEEHNREMHSLRFARKNIHNRDGDGINQRELQDELEYEKSVNSNLSLQLRKTQDYNSELLLEIQELERNLHESKRQAVEQKKLLQQQDTEKELKAMVDSLRKEIEELERDSHELTEENMDLLSQLKQANDKVKTREDIIVQLEMKMNNELYLCAEMETAKLKEDVEELRLKLKEYEEPYDGKLSSSRTLIDDLNSSVMMVRSKNAQLERELQSSEEHICELLKEMESLKVKMEGHEKEMSLFMSQKGLLNAYCEKISKAEQEHRGALKRVEELEALNRELKVEKTRDLTAIRKKMQDFQEHALATDSKYRDTLQVMAILRVEKLSLDKEMSILLSAKEATEANVTELQSFNIVLQEKLHVEQGKNAKLLQQCNEKEAENTQLLQQCKEKEVKNTQLSEQVKVTMNQLKVLEQTITELETSAKEVEANTGAMQTENMVCRSRIKELEEEKLTFESSRSASEARLQELEALNGELSEKLKELKVQLESLEEEKLAFKSSRSASEARLQELEALNEELLEKLKNSQEDIDWARENTNTLVNEIRELEGELKSDMVVHQRLKQSISELESQKLDWQSQFDELNNKNVQLLKDFLKCKERCKDILNEKDALLVILQEQRNEKESNENSLQALIKQQANQIQQLVASSSEEKLQQALLDASLLTDEKLALEQEVKHLQVPLTQAKKDDREHKAKHMLLEASLRTDEKLELEGNVLKLEQMLKQAEKDVSSLKQNLDFQFQEATLKEQHMTKTLNKITMEAQILQDENLEFHQKTMGLEAQCAAAELERRKLSMAMSKMESDLEVLQREREMKEREIDGLEAQCAAAELERRKLSMATSKMETNLEVLQREKEMKERAINGLEVQSAAAEVERMKLSMALSKMETDLEVLKREKEDKKKEEEIPKVSLGAVFKFENDLEVLQKEKDVRERAFVSLKEEKESLEASLHIAEQEIANLKERVKSFAEVSSAMEHSKALLKDNAVELNKMKQHNQELSSKLREEHAEREELGKKVAYLEEELRRRTAVLASMELKLNRSESFTSNDGSPDSSLSSSPSRVKSRVGVLSVTPSAREARPSADLCEKVKVLEGELKMKMAELELSRQQMKEQQAQMSIKNEGVDVAKQQFIAEQSSCNTKHRVKEVTRLQSQNAVFCQQEIELISKNTSEAALQNEIDNLKEEKRVLEMALSNFNAAADSDLLKKIASLEVELAEVLESNNMYKKELQRSCWQWVIHRHKQRSSLDISTDLSSSYRTWRDVDLLLHGMLCLEDSRSIMIEY